MIIILSKNKSKLYLPKLLSYYWVIFALFGILINKQGNCYSVIYDSTLKALKIGFICNPWSLINITVVLSESIYFKKVDRGSSKNCIIYPVNSWASIKSKYNNLW